MARINNLSNFLTDVATAIKTKKGSEASIPASNFDTEILALPSQGVYEQRVLNISANGTQTITPSSGFDAIDELALTVAVPEKQLQSKTYSFTQNTNIQLLPDTGYDGFNQVNLEIDVPQESGENVKLFDTIEHMQQDENPQEGDLAVVYREEIQAITEESEFDSCTFPNTVVLEEAFSDNIYGSFRSTGSGFFDGRVNMSSSNFSFDGFGDKHVRITYTSSDGITYTRTDGGEELQEFGTTIKYEPMEPWNDVIGNFMKISGNYFEGLYEYIGVKDTDKTAYIKLLNGGTYEIQPTNCLTREECEPYLEYIQTNLNEQTWACRATFVKSNNTLRCFCYKYSNNYCTDFQLYLDGEDFRLSNKPNDYNPIGYEITKNGNTYSHTQLTLETRSGSNNSNNRVTNFTLNVGDYVTVARYDADSIWTNNNYWIINKSIALGNLEGYTNTYSYAPTQLTAVAEDVFGTIFMGKNGVESGVLTTNVSSMFNDVNAELFIKIQQVYNNMTPLIATNDNKTGGLPKTIILIPTKTDGTSLLDTSNVTNMGSMFEHCSNLTIIPLLDTSSATNMNYMFSSCSNLTTIPLLDTSNVTNMDGMFSNCSNLTTIPLLDTSNVTDMNYMFSSCSNLTTIPLLDMSSATNISYMFVSCLSLTTIPLLDTSNVTNMNGMFSSCSSLTTIPLLNTSNVTNTGGMFSGCSNLTTVPLLDTSNVTNMNGMFGSCSSLTAIPLLDTSSATNISCMFENCPNLTTIPQLNTSSATNMYSMFSNCSNLTTIPLLDTSNVTDMNYMFNNCSNLTIIPLLDTSSATFMDYMFWNCSSLTTVPLLDTSSATNMSGMFSGCTSLEEIDLSGGTINSSANHSDIFKDVPTNCTIYVKDQASKTTLESWDNTHTYTIKT